MASHTERWGTTPDHRPTKNANYAGGVTDRYRCCAAKGAARQGTLKRGGPQRRSLRATGGWRNPMALLVADTRLATRCSLGDPAVPGNHACVPKSHPVTGAPALARRRTGRDRIEAGHNPGDVSARLRGHDPDGAVTPAQLWPETPPGWLDGEPPGATGQPKLAPPRPGSGPTGGRPRPWKQPGASASHSLHQHQKR
jgi:hypothetical protein